MLVEILNEELFDITGGEQDGSGCHYNVWQKLEIKGRQIKGKISTIGSQFGEAGKIVSESVNDAIGYFVNI